MVGHCPIPRDVDSEFKDGQGVRVADVSTNEGGPLRLLLRSLPDTVVSLCAGPPWQSLNSFTTSSR